MAPQNPPFARRCISALAYDFSRFLRRPHEAKTHPSCYVEEAAQGREIIIARAGKPVARIILLVDVKVTRKIGLLDGKARIPEDFNAPLPKETHAEFFRRQGSTQVRGASGSRIRSDR
ncbi:MAG: type II toxin-antitoxin system Phd/YefM family antitoxin [Acidiferrobacterales bacterium]